MNNVTLIGRLTKDPELRTTANGVSVCTFTLAVDRRFKQEGQPDADFIPVVVWKGQADNCAKYLGKGRQAAVVGSMQTRSYDAPDGTKRHITEVVANSVQFLDRAEKTSESAFFSPHNANSSNVQAVDESEEIPF